ncbi:RNA polymerase sigma-70 factor [Pedobacter xixiisoli]|uniref:RNA polymerase sigma-70 factor, ECF subfamily n=1 Tax=Pedobacter xixiisoli TaxID=1476464 RepID=A0A286A8T8_9SPHI|nr:RNA polymerase sigma-70 factor [Pedobacter xixiisoli]SOD18292.1 RNA polymerase sigma-70 factor, ECF subfamily [Pedobacter xixiisoli]
MSFNKVQLYSDQILLDMLKLDKRQAFDAIYNKYWEGIYLYIAKIIKDEEVAQDLLQEIFVSFWLRCEELEIESLKAYLFTAARYSSLTYIKQNIKKNNYEESMSEFFSQHDHSLEQNIDAKELANFIDDQLQHLPEKMREIYVLSRKELLSHKEISERLSISDKTVKKQIGNALKIFRLRLSDLYILILLLYC